MELIRDVTRAGVFSNSDHLWALGKERREKKEDREAAYETKLKGLVQYLKVTDRRIILCAKITYAWLSVRSTTVSGTVISATEFCAFLMRVLQRFSPKTSRDTSAVVAQRLVTHKLSCNTGCLVLARDNKIRDKLLYISQCSFTSVSVRSKPLIHQGRTRSEQDIRQGSDKDKETWG